MNTFHQIFFKNSTEMSELASSSIDLIITSPPYPMIEMWDPLFCRLNPKIKKSLDEGNGKVALTLMHTELIKVWEECVRVLKQGGLICINIGDATRKIANNFQLFPNHQLITEFFQGNGFISLPCIIWRKPTNAPNKFMGSGMLPPNAYVTLEHEYILLFRKGEKKLNFSPKSTRRYKSAYFWEERNKWFSDIWSDFIGITQSLPNSGNIRGRSAAFPLELPYRLVNMFSIYGDTILDPFWGTGTTTIAAMICGRNSIGYEINAEFRQMFRSKVKEVNSLSKKVNTERLKAHINFIHEHVQLGKEIKYVNKNYDFKVITSQEKELLLYNINKISVNDEKIIAIHEPCFLNHE